MYLTSRYLSQDDDQISHHVSSQSSAVLVRAYLSHLVKQLTGGGGGGGGGRERERCIRNKENGCYHVNRTKQDIYVAARSYPTTNTISPKWYEKYHSGSGA